MKLTNVQESFDHDLKLSKFDCVKYIELIEMVGKKEGDKRAFSRTKESRTSVVNFKDCRPTKSLEAQSMKPGETGFIKHLGQVKYIEKSNLKIEVPSKRAEAMTKDTDEHKLLVLADN
jgi:hypothetical protein